jgi:hypothetical protein
MPHCAHRRRPAQPRAHAHAGARGRTRAHARGRRGARRALLATALACSLVSAATFAVAPAGAFKTPRVRHVFVIVLENQGYAATFGTPSADPYLAQTLAAEGALLETTSRRDTRATTATSR